MYVTLIDFWIFGNISRRSRQIPGKFGTVSSHGGGISIAI